MATSSKQTYEFGDWLLDPAEHQLLHHGEPVSLTPKVFDILLLLVENAGSLVTKDEFMQRAWPDAFVEDAVLAQNISQLRKALGDSVTIETVPKKGYRFLQTAKIVETLSLPEAANGDRTRVQSGSIPAGSGFVSQATPQNRAEEESQPRAPHGEARRHTFVWIAVAVGVALALALGWWVQQHSQRAPGPQLIQFDVELRSLGSLGSEVGTDV